MKQQPPNQASGASETTRFFCTQISSAASAAGETVTVGSLLSFGLAIKGWYANKDSKASKENVRVSAKLLDDLTAVFNDAAFAGGEITLTVEGRCGYPEAGTQTKSITATLDKGEPPAPKSAITRVFNEGHEGEVDTLVDGGKVMIEGKGLAGATECTISCKDVAGNEHSSTYHHIDPEFSLPSCAAFS